MAGVKEAVHIRTASNIAAEAGKSEKYEYEPVPLEDAYKWKDTLRFEIAFWRDYDEFKDKPKDISDLDDRKFAKYVSKASEKQNNFKLYMGDGDNVRGIYYVKESGYEEKKYIYDEVYDIVYKIPVTRISKYKVHSVEELDYQKNNIKEEINKKMNYTLVSQSEVTTKKVGSVTCYEPDLNKFTQESTKLVFYKVNGSSIANQTKEMTISDWISSNRPSEITEGSDKYVLYDYEHQIWANIKVVNTKGTEDTGDDVESWWTWIPRYACKNTSSTGANGKQTGTTEIEFITTDNKLASDGVTPIEGTESLAGYEILEAFKGNTKKGMWVSKFEPSAKTTTNTGEWAYYIPEMTGFDKNRTELAIYNDNATSFVEYKKLSEVNDLSKFAKENKWFDYYNNKWANIRVINTKGTEDTGDDIESWWVWIPRYAYKNTGGATDVIFVDVEDEPIDGSILPAGYEVPEAFKGNTKKGMWASKYEPTAKSTDVPVNINSVPDLTGFTGTNIKIYLPTYNDTKSGFNANPTEYTAGMNLEQFAQNNNWYDYSEQAWANIKVVNTKGTADTSDDIESWWVWIPRYAYKNTGGATEIILIGTNNKDLNGNSLLEGYEIPEAFKQNSSKRGMWASKYEPTEN